MRDRAGVSALVTASLVAALTLTACAREGVEDDTTRLTSDTASGTLATEAIRVSEVQVGKGIDADMKVRDQTNNFMPRDTVYFSIATSGTAQNATLMLMVKADADSSTVHHDTKTVNAVAPAVTEFHFSKPEGLKVGKYTAEIWLNNALVETKAFEVKTSET